MSAETELGVLAPSAVGGEPLVNVDEHPLDAVMFLEWGQADRVGVVGLQQPELLIFESLLLPSQVATLIPGLCVDAVEDVLDHSGERVGSFG